MDKAVRLQRILELVEGRKITRQDELVSLLTELGFGVTQASVSRDLDELGIVKAGGYYTLPALDKRKAKLGVKSVEAAGDVLIVVKSEPGFASAAATHIDSAGIGEIVGTIAGDDTIFVAVRYPNQQRSVIKRLLELFGG
ncbi:MAG TPA: hypothetical protein PKE66_02435 [Pyrinomonadaceae bacterium]|nr:hypothetical protein [Pyrinomonadaceae bacterium]